MMSGKLRVTLLLALATTAWGASPPAAAVAFSTVENMLAGDVWSATRTADVATALAGRPADWPVMGIGTTNADHANGEVVALGTAGWPDVRWCDPEEPQGVWRVLDTMPFVAVAAGDPATAIRVPARAGEELAPQVTALCQQRGLALAGVRAEGRLRAVNGTVAFNLSRAGAPLTGYGVNAGDYLLPFAVSDAAEWQVAGFWTTVADQQRVLSIGGHALHLHGQLADGRHGGHLAKALVESAVITVYPLADVEVRRSNVTLRNGRREAGVVRFEVANTGGLWLLHVPLVGQVGEQVVLRKQLGNLAPGETRQLAVPLSWPTPDAPLTITADPRHEIRETDTTDNVLRL